MYNTQYTHIGQNFFENLLNAWTGLRKVRTAVVLVLCLYMPTPLTQDISSSFQVKFSNLNRQFYTHFCRLRTTQNGAVWQSQHLYNCIPEAVRKLPMRRFKEVLKSFLLKKAFYSLDEFTTIGSKEHFQL
ncbi:uncharacterized protein LOC116173201 isoform X2 [Photinus pyralis]|uniref:uncharacterized protein LOC116173201 isoform X2 n=1 Tax=Photinus pyralis TaxID=7054 RepID=UPI0012670FE3|nr:uncharacterized protein LOC116173201 isoform X2 [Photinus pyralis]